jgi:hypothetical protein
MYKKTADLHHLHERTASHATKGTGRGTVWWNTTDPNGFDAKKEIKAKQQERRRLHQQQAAAIVEFKSVLKLTDDAVARNDFETVRALRPSVRALSKILRKTNRDMQEIRKAISDLKHLTK